MIRRVMLVALVLVLAAGLAAPGRVLSQPQLTKVRVVHVPVLIFAPLYVGIERGYFARQGIEVELITTPGGVSSFAVLAGGRAEVVVGGLGAALFNAAARELDFKVVGPVHMERPPVSTPLVISKRAWDSGEIRSVRDLRGKRVSTNVLGSATEFWVHAAMLKGGLTIDDIQLVAVNFPEVPAALANNAIAAGLLGEPLATLAEDQGQIVRLAEDFVNGVQVTAPAPVVKKARSPYHEPNGQMNFNDFKRLQEFFRRRGYLTYEKPLEPKQYIDTSYVREALTVLGSFNPR
ncbi:MAG: ABC transporter substrate-binding protein [Armatimonadetes bacterium]|nr:ABC transporter substrate-binding protein [Armatimonadota bacterium]